MHGKRVLRPRMRRWARWSAGSALTVIASSLIWLLGLPIWVAINEVDRQLSNQLMASRKIAALGALEVIGSSTEILIAMNWTDFDADGQTTPN